jgi:hypothetical protein
VDLLHHRKTRVLFQDTKQISQGPDQAMTPEGTAIDVLDHAQLLNQS